MTIDVSRLLAEFSGVDLGDVRVEDRLQRIVTKLGSAPDESFPKQMGTVSDREALYRFLGNEKVTLDRVLGGHRDQTLERISSHRIVRIVHDTSEFVFEGERDGLHVRRGSEKASFYGHFALATVADDSREPLGLLGVRPFANTDYELRKLTSAERARRQKAMPREQKKSGRWESLALETQSLLPDGVEAIHLMDMEADDYNVFSALQSEEVRFVIRIECGRLSAEGIGADELLASQPTHQLRDVFVSKRSRKKATNQHPTRSERKARLSVRASTITFRRPQVSKATLKEVTLSIVHVFEANPPTDEPPIQWMLVTSEPVTTLEEIAAVVDHYRGRWIIEEYFKALKTGCAFEKRQLGSFDSLVRALGLFAPMAWMLLAVRNIARESPRRSADEFFSADQLQLLRVILNERNYKLPLIPTARDAMLGIAALGGHIKNNGDPGWIVLGRGLETFYRTEEGWRLARSTM